jgi:hypothetical protein
MQNLRFNPGIYDLRDTLSSATQKAYAFTQKNIITPLSKSAVASGVAMGAGSFLTEVLLVIAVHSLLFSLCCTTEACEQYERKIRSTPVFTVVLGPIEEEIIYRAIFQRSFNWCARQGLPDQEIDLFSLKVKLSSLVSIATASTVFGLAHLQNGTGATQALVTTLSGACLGALYQEYGLSASIPAHITNNALAIFVGPQIEKWLGVTC